ncbi:unnamed protein product [Urochloa decumbens]
MLSNKRSADDLTRSLCSGEDFKLDNLANLCGSVVSIALSNGQKVLFKSSGIAVECQSCFTKFVTPANLVIALRAAEKAYSNVKIEVRDGRCVSIGFLEECDLDHIIAVVKVPHALDVYCIPLNHEVELMPHCRDVVALGRDIFGNVMAASGTCTDSRGSEDSEYLMFSTCELSEEVMQGSALFHLNGSFVGMNLFSDMERPIFMPRNIIIEHLWHLRTLQENRVFLDLVKPFRDTKIRIGQRYFHPKGGMKASTFEETFGDAYPSGVWGEFRNGVPSNIRENVVALASFNGESKFFECTGFFIDHIDKCSTILTSASLVRNPDGTDEIVEGLKIEVLLPNKDHIEGKLEHYSLHYNVALVSVMNYSVSFPASLKHDKVEYCTKVAAVGRRFESGVLVAASGKHTWWSGSWGCASLHYTTCKIAKVGSGGPLVDVNGNFVGMNFYNPKMGTPFLRCDVLCGILNYFKTKETKYWDIVLSQETDIVRDGEEPSDFWISPEPSYMDEEELENERAALDNSEIYGYVCGKFVVRK